MLAGDLNPKPPNQDYDAPIAKVPPNIASAVQWIAPTPTLNLRSRYGTLPAKLPDGRRNRRREQKTDATTSGQAESDRE